jgi:hypothetical protein
MANEITVQSSLRINKGKLSYQSLPQSFQADMAATTPNGPSPSAISASLIGTDVSFAQLTTPGMCRIMNLDSTNYVEVGAYDAGAGEFYPLFEILPGQSYVFRLSRWLGKEMSGTLPGTGTVGGGVSLRIKATVAPCKVLVEAFEA